jgi:alpha-tubulin suppressor-like RCC1 family protein
VNQLGTGQSLAVDMYNMETIPTLVEGFGNWKVKKISAGHDHAAAITENGSLYMWGMKLWLEPHEMTALSEQNVVDVACGKRYTTALTGA